MSYFREYNLSLRPKTARERKRHGVMVQIRDALLRSDGMSLVDLVKATRLPASAVRSGVLELEKHGVVNVEKKHRWEQQHTRYATNAFGGTSRRRVNYLWISLKENE